MMDGMETGLQRLEGPATTEAVVVALPGGMERSYHRATRHQPSYLRMLPMGASLRRWGRPHGVAVWIVRYRYRGWNGADMSPLDDGLFALEKVRRTHGDVPVILLGHSMGGRSALRLAGDPSVRSVVALAPWLPDGEPTSQLAGRRVMIGHGSRDRVTDPAASRAYAARAAAEHGPGTVQLVIVEGEGHSLLRRPLTWDRLIRRHVAASLGLPPA